MRRVLIAEGLAWRQGGLINRRQVLQEGLSARQLRTLLSTGRWKRITPGVFLTPVDLDRDEFDTARLRAAWLGVLAVPGSVATGMAALMLHGIEGLPQKIPSEVRPPGRRSVPGPVGVTIRRYRADPPTRTLGEFHITDVVPALGQALGHLDRNHAVAVLDSALHQEYLSVGDLEEVARLVARRKGARSARLAIALSDGRAESPLESWARLRFIDAGIPPTTLQKEFRDEDHWLIARGDLAWRRRDGGWVSVEMDGRAVHSEPEALFHDRHRQNDLMMDRKLILLRFTSPDLRSGYAELTVRRALRS